MNSQTVWKLLILLGFVCMAFLEVARAQRVNDEPESAIVLSPWGPAIRDHGTDATYGSADTSAMRIWSAERGGGSLWYSWTSPVSGSVRIFGHAVLGQQLFMDRRRLLSSANDQASIMVTSGRRYLFTVVGPSWQANPFDFGLGFSYEFELPVPQFLTIESPGSGEVHRTGGPILLSAHLERAPEGFAAVEFLVGDSLGGTRPLLALPDAPYGTNWVPELSGKFDLSAGIRLDNGFLIAITPVRSITVLPANDGFADRALLSGLHASGTGSTRLAEREPGEPVLSGSQDARSLWWRWTAPQSVEMQVVLSGRSLVGLPAVYRGVELDRLERISGEPEVELPQHPEYMGTSRVRFLAIAGEEYAIAYETSDFGLFPVKIDVAPAAPPPPPLLRVISIFPDITLEIAAGPETEIALQACSASWQFEPIADLQTDGKGIVQHSVSPPPESGFMAFRAVVRP